MSQSVQEPPADRFGPTSAQDRHPPQATQAVVDPGSVEFFTSESIDQFAAALAKAQGVFKNPEKNKTNPHFKSKYADLAAIIDAARPGLASNELALVQLPTRSGNGMVLRTLLLHSSGQHMGCVIPLKSTTNGPQAFGSELTYMRRYAASAILMLAADDDDDGNEAQNDASHSRSANDRQAPPKGQGSTTNLRDHVRAVQGGKPAQDDKEKDPATKAREWVNKILLQLSAEPEKAANVVTPPAIQDNVTRLKASHKPLYDELVQAFATPEIIKHTGSLSSVFPDLHKDITEAHKNGQAG